MRSHVAMFVATLGVAFLALSPAASQAATIPKLSMPAQADAMGGVQNVNYYRHHRRHYYGRGYGSYGYSPYSYYTPYSYYGSPGFSIYLGGGGHRRHHRGW
jgi:hypothetical protein